MYTKEEILAQMDDITIIYKDLEEYTVMEALVNEEEYKDMCDEPCFRVYISRYGVGDDDEYFTLSDLADNARVTLFRTVKIEPKSVAVSS